MKNTPFHFKNSFLSEHYCDNNITAKKATKLLKQIGPQRDKGVAYMRSFIQGGDYILADGTHLVSPSQKLTIAKQGYNSLQSYDPQVNSMFSFSSKLKLPVFYRILPLAIFVKLNHLSPLLKRVV